ncbi:trypsin-like peptidase domain-containing protein [uncultured Thiodictyon sp.]|jgi:hypothetical protein|uniref:trypsin-like peptidase domain-containing protein n=1 Tax=uncultured Thiodictyon sp. TaxID=1846217 RepID=UPI0025DAB085|nr:trypsin-like peptidase domain-containing protein [uncultured Thiodictyon sp.]
MTAPRPDNAAIPPYLMRVLLHAAPEPDLSGRGSGILLASDWVLTARHVVADSATRRTLYDPDDLAVWDGRAAHPIAAVIAADQGEDLALLRLAQPLPGIAPADLVAGLGREDLQRLTPDLAACGYPGARRAAAPLSYPGLQTLLAGQDQRERIGDLQLRGGLPEGMSGGALYLQSPPGQPVLGLLYLGGQGAATSRVIPAATILKFLGRAAPDLLRLVHTLEPGALTVPAPKPHCVTARTWDQQRGPLRDLLLALPDWDLLAVRRGFVTAALGEHPAARLTWEGDGFTVAGELVSKLKYYSAAPLPDGRHAVCALLAEARTRKWDQAPAIGDAVRRLAAAFGCESNADAAGAGNGSE